MVKNIVQKRQNKRISVAEFKEAVEARKVRRKTQVSKKYTVDISQRHKFKRAKQRVRDIDVGFAHIFEEEVALLPHSFAKDQIGFSLF